MTSRRPAGTVPAPVAGTVLAVLVALLTVLVVAPAWAHPTVAGSYPADGEVLDRAPDEISMTFGNEVAAPIASIKVYDQGSQRVDLDDATVSASDPRTVVAHVRDDLPDGPYVVIWRAVGSDDGHTVLGRFTFHVGDGATLAAPVDVPTTAFAAGSAAPLPTALRLVVLASTLCTAGAGVFFVVALRDRPRAAWGRRRARVRWLVRTAAGVAVLGSVLQLPVEAAVRAGGLTPDALAGQSLVQVLTTTFGMAAIARALVLLPIAVGVTTTSRALVTSWWGVALVSLVVDGHSVAVSPVPLMVAADLVHVVAGAVWFGGLAAMAVVLWHPEQHGDPEGLVAVVRWFSTVAGISLVAVSLAGGVMGLVSVGGLAAATSTRYGALLLTKVAGVLGVVALGARNRQVLLRRLPAATTDVAAAATGEGVAATGEAVAVAVPVDRAVLRSLGRSVLAEVLVLVWVLGLTAALAGHPTAVEELADRAEPGVVAVDGGPGR